MIGIGIHDWKNKKDYIFIENTNNEFNYILRFELDPTVIHIMEIFLLEPLDKVTIYY